MNQSRLQARLTDVHQSLVTQNLDRHLRLVPDVCVDLSSNDYLGVARDLDCLETFKVMHRHQFGSTGSRLLGGNSAIACEFEQTFSEWLGGASARFFNSGYHANVGVLSAVVGPGDLVLMDRNCHASIIDGVRLSGARFKRFGHNDMGHLERLLLANQDISGVILVVTESLFSMDGDLAPLADIVTLCRRYGAALMVDEAHALGVLGPDGRGVVAANGLFKSVDIWVGAFGKAWGGAGAVVVGSETLIQVLTSTARSLIFSTAVPPMVLDWNLHVCRRMPTFSDRRARLARIGQTLGSQSHIVPLTFHSYEMLLDGQRQFEAIGIFAPVIRPPTVAPGTFRIRLSLRSDLPDGIVESICQLISRLTPMLRL